MSKAAEDSKAKVNVEEKASSSTKGPEEPKKTQKRDALRTIELAMQERWEARRAFEVDAPTVQEHPGEATLHTEYPKYMGTFPYPYMNGRLHLGHCFTITKVDFAVGYERMLGKRALFPLGFHCTGMPIKACADKLANEVARFGEKFERFSEEETVVPAVEGMSLDDPVVINADPTKVGAKKGKVVAKSTGEKYQFQIMRSSEVPNDEIAKFADAKHWLYYFPPLAIKDLKAFGAKIDRRRSFMTTDVNPYYDSFVRWQMNKLKALNKIKFGERYTIYSPFDGQPCMDHDRASGEALGPQEYTAIKMAVIEWSKPAAEALGEVVELIGKTVFFVAATFRPETMYGQTNCFVGTDITYGLFLINDTEVFLCTHRAARNMAFQGFSKERGVVTQLASIKGALVVGTKVNAPLSSYGQVYVLPMENVLATKGTGVVTSVPSDSPDDFAALNDLKKKADYYKIDPAWAAYEPVPIISTPNYGNLAAPTICQQRKINSQKDREQLAEAKDVIYKEGFYNGTMLVGEYAGKPVQEVKPLIREFLIAKGDGFIYNEPEGLIISRSGDECVVALCDQWYLDYGEKEWRGLAEKCLEKMNSYGSECRNQFEKTLEWLNKWACARSYGLGSRLPWDPQYLVESLSDSTIYMAYYTVAHLLHGGTLDGSKPGPLGIKASQMTDQVWEYIFVDGPLPTVADIPRLQLDTLRREFKYFYPLDLRVSGKDLIPNHLTFFIYNHVAIFPESQWPRAVRANGHLMLNQEKMSKRTGNFMTMADCVNKYGADATRIALADAGDQIEDANFGEVVANAAILRLHTLKEWSEEMIEKQATLRTGPADTFYDRVFASEMNQLTIQTRQNYSDMLYRDALKYGFYEMQNVRDLYREAVTGSSGMHRDLILRFIELQVLLIAPIAPHWSEHIWQDVLKREGSVLDTRFPNATEQVDEGLLAAATYVRKLVKSIRDQEIATQKKKKKGKADAAFDPSKPKELKLFLATKFPEWQDVSLEVLRAHWDEKTNTFDDVKIRAVLAERGVVNKKTMPFVVEFKKRVEKSGAAAFDRTLLFDERSILEATSDYIKRQLGYAKLEVILANNGGDVAEEAKGAEPGEPAIVFRNI